MAKIVKLIYTEKTIGAGKDKDPCRIVHELWTEGGELVCSFDWFKKEKEVFEIMAKL